MAKMGKSKPNGEFTRYGSMRKRVGIYKMAEVAHLTPKVMKAHSKQGQLLLLQRVQGLRVDWRGWIFLLVNEPQSSTAAHVFGIVSTTHVLAWTFCCVVESSKFYQNLLGMEPTLWIFLRLYFTIFFTLECILRIISQKPLSSALREPLIYLDLFVVLPFWLRVLLFPSTISTASYFVRHDRPGWLRFFEAAGDFRLLKLSRNFSGAELLVKAISRSLRELVVPVFMLMIMVVAFSSIMFDVEWDPLVHYCSELWIARGVKSSFLRAHAGGAAWGCETCAESSHELSAENIELNEQRCLTCNGYPPGHFECAGVAFDQTFPDVVSTMWYTFVTVSTVGYGDVTPSTWEGKIFGSIFIFAGVIFIAMPLNSVGSHFSAVWKEYQLLQLKAGMRDQLLKQGISPDDVRSAFDEFDEDGNGEIDNSEFGKFITNVLKLNISRAEISNLWRSIDIDGLGAVDFAEFSAVLFADVKRAEPEPEQPEGAGKFADAAKSMMKEIAKAKDEESMIRKKEKEKAEEKTSQNVAQDLAEIKQMVASRLDTVEKQMASLAIQLSAVHGALVKGNSAGQGSSGNGRAHSTHARDTHTRGRSGGKDRDRSQSRGRSEREDAFFGIDAASAVPTRERPAGHRSRPGSPVSSPSPGPEHNHRREQRSTRGESVRREQHRRGLTPARPPPARPSASGDGTNSSSPSDEPPANFKLCA